MENTKEYYINCINKLKSSELMISSNLNPNELSTKELKEFLNILYLKIARTTINLYS